MAPASASMEAFTALGLSETLAEAAVALGWAAPSKIQQEAVPHAVSGTYACMRV
jgi:ATP-dependent RNA helicase DDX47/RRP3